MAGTIRPELEGGNGCHPLLFFDRAASVWVMLLTGIEASVQHAAYRWRRRKAIRNDAVSCMTGRLFDQVELEIYLTGAEACVDIQSRR